MIHVKAIHARFTHCKLSHLWALQILTGDGLARESECASVVLRLTVTRLRAVGVNDPCTRRAVCGWENVRSLKDGGWVEGGVHDLCEGCPRALHSLQAIPPTAALQILTGV